MKRIAVDMDEVIADAVAEHLLRYNRDHGAEQPGDMLLVLHLEDPQQDRKHDPIVPQPDHVKRTNL